MKATVKLFAIAKQLVGAETVCVDLPEAATVKDLRAALVEQQSALADVVQHAMFAVNTEYVGDDALLPADAEIACIPPVSGG